MKLERERERDGEQERHDGMWLSPADGRRGDAEGEREEGEVEERKEPDYEKIDLREVP
jgi:hypothetical protein